MKTVIIGGISIQSGFSEALIIQLIANDYHVIAIARNSNNKDSLIHAFTNHPQVEFIWGDLNDSQFLSDLIQDLENKDKIIDTYIHNAAKLVLKPFIETDVSEFEECWDTSVKTAIIASQVILPSMLQNGKGTILFTGATASIRGNQKASAFAIAKFGLRALSQSLAREFGTQGIHVAHIVTDGVIAGPRAQDTFGMDEEKCIQPTSIATLYINLMKQDPSCWTQEIDVRPSQEFF